MESTLTTFGIDGIYFDYIRDLKIDSAASSGDSTVDFKVFFLISYLRAAYV
jgi:hypothetical protein